jgi:hypothetical protein
VQIPGKSSAINWQNMELTQFDERKMEPSKEFLTRHFSFFLFFKIRGYRIFAPSYRIGI